MADLSSYKVDDTTYEALGVQGLSDTPGLSTAAMQAKFDERCDEVKETYNDFIDGLQSMIEDTVSSNTDKIPSSKAIVDYVQYMGGGDMTRATYDTNNDGIVDNSSALGGHASSYFAVDDGVQACNMIPYPFTSGNSYTTNGITFTVNTDLSISVSGTATADAEFTCGNLSYTGTATISGGTSSVSLKVGSNTCTGTSITASVDDNSVSLLVASGTTVSDTVYPMVEKGSRDHSWTAPSGLSGCCEYMALTRTVGKFSLASGGTTFNITSPLFGVNADCIIDVYYSDTSLSATETLSGTTLTITFDSALESDVTIKVRVDNR